MTQDKMVAGVQSFYWSGTDNEDLYCICGTPHPEQIFDEALPAKIIRRCIQCGAIADLDESAGDWVVRKAAR